MSHFVIKLSDFKSVAFCNKVAISFRKNDFLCDIQH